MHFHRAGAQPQFARNHIVGPALGHAGQDFGLARRQARPFALSGAPDRPGFTPSQRIVPTQSPFKTVDKGATLVLQKPAGQTIHCIAGSVWITHDGDTKDVVLEAARVTVA